MKSKLYIKEGCPWCHAATEWLDAKKFSYELIEVRNNKKAFDTMVALSGQTKTPTLQLPDGRVLADFGVEQLPEFLGL
ncbi:MAG: glutaredoxin family protein [Chthoniobacterales bacterium]